MTVVDTHAPLVGVTGACRAVGVSRATWYRRRARALGGAAPAPAARSRSHPRRLTDAERDHVVAVLCSDEFRDRSPRAVYAILLERGEYLCSIRTMYRILHERRAVRERRALRNHPQNAVPRCRATAPNEVWSWDITKLPGPARSSFSLYVVIDIFSRSIVDWLVAERESTFLATRMIEQQIVAAGIDANQLTVHSDRGAPMTSRTMAQMLADLGVERSHSRPRVSNDNPFSEAQFKTMKYGATWPTRFVSLHHAREWAASFVQWYNHEHRHEGIGLFTPADVHAGRHLQLDVVRQRTLDAAYVRNPERFVRGRPVPPVVPAEVWINRPGETTLPLADAAHHLPTLQGGRGIQGGGAASPLVAAPETFDRATALRRRETRTELERVVQSS
jgi:putative transposase